MKKNNLLSKAQMKKILGGVYVVADCRTDNSCGTSEECCPDDSSAVMKWKCQRFSYAWLPFDMGVERQWCGGVFLDV